MPDINILHFDVIIVFGTNQKVRCSLDSLSNKCLDSYVMIVLAKYYIGRIERTRLCQKGNLTSKS